MGKSRYILFILLIIATTSYGQGSIGVFADVNGTNCDLWDNSVGMLPVHIVLVYSPCATGCRFRVIESEGFQGTYLYEVPNFDFTVTGNSRTGVNVDFNGQVISPVRVMTINYDVMGMSDDCSWIRIAPHLDDGVVYLNDCSPGGGSLVQVPGGMANVHTWANNCPCSVPAEETSWGRIKALYH